MQSLQMFLFGVKSSEKYIQELKADKQAVGGFGGIIGRKKGAVAMYLNFSGIRMVFVCCHLAAHEHKVEKRNSEFQRISHSLFSKNSISQSADITVWLGDLNYRLQGISSIPARQMIEENRQSNLRRKDQLLQESNKGELFNGYTEGALKFKSTYKYDVGSSIYDTSHKLSLNRHHVQDATFVDMSQYIGKFYSLLQIYKSTLMDDRVLFKVDHSSGLDALLTSYESLECFISSDHKPVKAHLCLKVRSADD